MKISLFGYGKMGKAIESIAQERGHEIVQRIGSSNSNEPPSQHADVVIEFSLPSTAVNNIDACINAGIPVIVGTTGWLDELEHVSERIHSKEGAMLYASNFSVGVNLFFEVNKRLAQLMNGRKEYTPLLEETHHVHKLDAPSGTAISLANDLTDRNDRLTGWSEQKAENKLQVISYRENEVPGTHKVTYSSNIDEITIEHKAHSRAGFALGAVLAAEWIVGRKGVFTMNDLLNI